MSNDEGRVNVPIFNALEQQRRLALHRRLRHPKCETTIDRRSHWYLVEQPSVDADNRNGAEIAAAVEAWRST